jgi:hypothetical protein
MNRVIAELLDTLTHGIPDLRGAACRGHPELFDVDRHDPRIEEAKALCADCPVLRDCRAWLASLPRSRQPSGIVAGRYIPAPKPPPAREPRPRAPSSRDRATAWLRGYLAQHKPVISTQVIADATASGITMTALHLARRDVGVRLERVRGEHGARHMWKF